jgi:hypothetical protein
MNTRPSEASVLPFPEAGLPECLSPHEARFGLRPAVQEALATACYPGGIGVFG